MRKVNGCTLVNKLQMVRTYKYLKTDKFECKHLVQRQLDDPLPQPVLKNGLQRLGLIFNGLVVVMVFFKKTAYKSQSQDIGCVDYTYTERSGRTMAH